MMKKYSVFIGLLALAALPILRSCHPVPRKTVYDGDCRSDAEATITYCDDGSGLVARYDCVTRMSRPGRCGV